MEEKVIKIEIPEGYEIDKEKSTLEKIVFKLKEQSLKSICSIYRKLFYGQKAYYFNKYGKIENTIICAEDYKNLNNCTSEKQAKKLLAINQLMNVAKYLNEGWQPDWNNYIEKKYTIYIEKNTKVSIDVNYCINRGIVYFKTEKLAQKAIDILGEETIKLALSTDW